MADLQRQRSNPLDFRREDVGYIMQRLRANESCSLVGVSSVGKSNLLQHLANPDVQRAYMNIAKVDDFRAIIIDPNMLGPLPSAGADSDQVRCWAGYELMMHRLFMAFYPFDALSEEDAQQFYGYYLALQDGTNPLYAYMGLRYFEMGLNLFFQRGIRIVFMFDEFEDLMKNMPARFFQTLRGVRDANKRLLSYLTFTRSTLPTLVDQFNLPVLEMEPFVELFNDSIRYIGPYGEVDARRMVENLMARNDRPLNEEGVRFLLWATGGYAGMIRSAFRLMHSLGPIQASSMMNDELAYELGLRRPMRSECRILWMGLTGAEQKLLRGIAGLSRYEADAEATAALTQKGLVRHDKPTNRLNIEPPVFRAFMSTNPEVTST